MTWDMGKHPLIVQLDIKIDIHLSIFIHFIAI